MSKRLLIGLFCGYLGLFALLGLLLPDRDFSPAENRVLAQRPALTWKNIRTGTFMADFETYVTDQFPLRDGWIAGKAWGERLSGKGENNGVYFSSDGGLIPRVDQPRPERVRANLTAVEGFLRDCPVPAAFALIPTAAQVWGDKLPQGAPQYDPRELYAQAGTIPGFVDLRNALESHRQEAIYYRTDHHWTSLGAYYGYEALSAALGYTPAPLGEKTTVTRDFYGTSWSSSGARWVEPDPIDIYVPEDGVKVTSLAGEKAEPRRLYDYEKLHFKDKYAFFLGGQQPLCLVETPHQGEKLLIVRDSYSDSLAPFLTQNFSELHLADLRYYKGSLGEYVREKGIDRVLVLYSVPNFISDGNLVWLTR